MNTQALAFNGNQLTPVSHNNQIWLTSSELAKSLGYAREDSVSQIYDRNKDEFTDAMTTVLRERQFEGLGESSGLQVNQRIFSLRGCHLIAMLSKTAIAKEFRKWVLDILDNHVQPATHSPKLPTDPKTAVLSVITRKGKDGIQPFLLVDYCRSYRSLSKVQRVELLASLEQDGLIKKVLFRSTAGQNCVRVVSTGGQVKPMPTIKQIPAGYDLIATDHREALEQAALLPPDLEPTLTKFYQKQGEQVLVSKQRLAELEFIAKHAVLADTSITLRA